MVSWYINQSRKGVSWNINQSRKVVSWQINQSTIGVSWQINQSRIGVPGRSIIEQESNWKINCPDFIFHKHSLQTIHKPYINHTQTIHKPYINQFLKKILFLKKYYFRKILFRMSDGETEKDETFNLRSYIQESIFKPSSYCGRNLYQYTELTTLYKF